MKVNCIAVIYPGMRSRFQTQTLPFVHLHRLCSPSVFVFEKIITISLGHHLMLKTPNNQVTQITKQRNDVTLHIRKSNRKKSDDFLGILIDRIFICYLSYF